MTDAKPDDTAVVQAAAHLLMNTVLDLIEADSHHFGTRPCQTCHTISVIVGRPFGCVRKAKEKHDG